MEKGGDVTNLEVLRQANIITESDELPPEFIDKVNRLTPDELRSLEDLFRKLGPAPGDDWRWRGTVWFI